MPGTSRTQATNTPADPSSASGRTTTRTDGAAPTTPNRDHTPTRSGVADTEHVFWVYGISCLDCAAKFEKNVATLPGVVAANLNTTTGKLSVVGHADVDTIRRLGRAEDYTITTKRNDDAPSEVHAARMELWRAGVSAALLLLALAVQHVLPRFDILSTGVTDAVLHAPTSEPFLSPSPHSSAASLSWAVKALLFGAIVVGGWSNARRAFFALPRLDFNMSVLMTTAVIGAIAIGEWHEGAVVAVLFAVSDWLEAWTYGRARRSIRDLIDLAPKRATVKRDGGEVGVPIEELVVGDIVVIRPGEKIPVDGVVVRGESAVDEAAITGESIPREKAVGADVYAGTLNTYGALEVRVAKPAEETTIAKIVQLVEEAEGSRAKSHAFVDRFAAVYTPVVIALATLIVVVPPLVSGAAWQPWIYRGLALLVVACPCALVIATPVSIVSAISNAARRGVLVKGGVHLEELARVRAIAFDKTGTLTKGQPVVTDVVSFGPWSEEELLRAAASVEQLSEHPVAKAIVRSAEERGISILPVGGFEALPGRGVKGVVDGLLSAAASVPESGSNGAGAHEMGSADASPSGPLYVGNVRLFRQLGLTDVAALARVERLQAEGKTTMLVGTDEQLLGVIAVADELRREAVAAVAELRRLGITRTVMLTGDNERAAEAIARQVGVDEAMAELLPQDKVRSIDTLKAASGKVAMVGDGVNDAPALATAAVGIAMGGAGTDTALETADVVLMSDDLSKLPFAVGLSRATLRIIKQNIYFAIAIKLVAVLAVFPGWLTLWLAILADMGATVIVTLNGMRLLAHGGTGRNDAARNGHRHSHGHGHHHHHHDRA